MVATSSNEEVRVVREALAAIDTHQKDLGEGGRDGINRMLAALDVVILQIPSVPTDEMVEELERIVAALHTAEEHVRDDNRTGALQALGLAQARLDRFAARFVEDAPAS